MRYGTQRYKPHGHVQQGWCTIAGKRIFFRSKWEKNYAHYLQFLKDKNEIIDWEYEPETFWFEDIKRGVRSYKPDFRITNKNKTIEYHEVKGWMDRKSNTKLKRMAKYHPEIKVILVDKKQYASISRISRLIPGWES